MGYGVSRKGVATVRTYWPGRRIVCKAMGMGLGLGMTTLLAGGIPTAVIATPWFTRMTPVRPQDDLFLGIIAANRKKALVLATLAAVLIGIEALGYLRDAERPSSVEWLFRPKSP